MTDHEIVDRILSAEGGFSNDPEDRGRATNYGITQATLGNWLGRVATVEDVRTLDVVTARDIYGSLYLKPFDGIDPEIKAHVVDIAVNSGVNRARALLALAENQHQRPVRVQLVIERLRHYARIMEADHTQAKFAKGWIDRACSFL